MFTLNGKKIRLSSNDTLDNLVNKISSALNTLPELLDLSFANDIKDGGKYTTKPPIFYMEGETLLAREGISLNEVFKVNLDQDFLKKLYVITKIQSTIEDFGLEDENQALQFALFNIESEFEEGVENLWETKSITIQTFKEMIEKNRTRAVEQSKTIDVWSGIKPTFPFTQFSINKINHQTEISNLLKQNSLMVFDSIKLNNIVIACFYQEMIKYNLDHKHLIDDYLNQDKILSKKIKAADIIRIMVTFTRTKYKMINVFVNEDTINLTIEGEPSLDKDSKFKNLIKKILVDMGEQEAYNNRIEKDFFYGSYSASINVPLLVLKDLITNDPNVYNISYINESALINTRKTNLNIFLKSPEEDVGVSIFEQPDTVGTLIRIKKIRGGSNFSSKVDSLMVKINKILQYTFDQAEDILKFYKKYIDLKVELTLFDKEIVKDKESELKLMVPDLFVANYTRLCNKPPTIVENEPESELVLKFPIYGESEPKLYKCPYPQHQYPGVRENKKLSNKNTFPFVPCCYQRPQSKTRNYRMYYNQEIYEQRINTGEIGKSLKILSVDRLGSLPSKIDKLLNYTTNIKFYRFGIPQSKSSCLSILNKVTGNLESDQTIRSQLAKRAELCKGEFNTTDIKEIVQKILDPNTYINPRFFKGALEDYYQLSFILFSKEEDDFSSYPNRFVRFICPLKKQVVLMIEHEEMEHVELIVDEETSNYINKLGKRPILTFAKSDFQIKRIFSMYKERFNYSTYDTESKRFVHLLKTHREEKSDNTFHTYPWENVSPNGKILKTLEPLNQYVDSYGQTRLVEFNDKGFSFIGQFEPLPCLNLPIKPLEYFIPINDRLSPQTIQDLKKKFPWCVFYTTKLEISNDYTSPYSKFKNLKRLAEYLLWAACHVYSSFNLKTGISVDDWIEGHTRVLENYSYSEVNIKPIFNVSELMIDEKFIFSSSEMRDKIRYNLSLISSANLKIYATNVYHSFFRDVSNFNVVYPAQLALTKKDYYQRTRRPYKLNILTSNNVQYIRFNTLYFIKDLFGYFTNVMCIFESSLDKLVESGSRFTAQKIILDETIMNVSVLNQQTIQKYVIGGKEPSIDVMVININTIWFYGLILPQL
jgi:hypothetical protein